MKFRKLTHILTVLAFSTLMHATQAYADIIKMDALLIDTDPHNTFQKFDDKLGTLIDVTYFFEGIFTVEGINDCCDTVAADWEGGIDFTVYTYFYESLIFKSYVVDYINISSFDIAEDGFLFFRFDFDFEVWVSVLDMYTSTIGQLGFSSYVGRISYTAPPNSDIYCAATTGERDVFRDDDGGSFGKRFIDCLSGVADINPRLVYSYIPFATMVPGPGTLAIFALSLMGIMSRRFKKQS